MHKLKRFGFNAVKESFDRLPTAVCFFDRSGGIVLCNRQMYRLSQHLLNSDLQYLEELQGALVSPPEGVTPLAGMESTFRFPDGLVWKFERAAVTDRYGETYIQLTAANVTELHRALEQLAEDNRRLEQDAEELRRLSENVEAVARERAACRQIRHARQPCRLHYRYEAISGRRPWCHRRRRCAARVEEEHPLSGRGTFAGKGGAVRKRSQQRRDHQDARHGAGGRRGGAEVVHGRIDAQKEAPTPTDGRS